MSAFSDRQCPRKICTKLPLTSVKIASKALTAMTAVLSRQTLGAPVNTRGNFECQKSFTRERAGAKKAWEGGEERCDVIASKEKTKLPF